MKLILDDVRVVLESYVSVWPTSVTKTLSYWHKFGRPEVIFTSEGRKLLHGEIRKLYELDNYTRDDGRKIHRLTTLPGFAAQIFTLLTDGGAEVEFVDNRLLRDVPFDIEAGAEGLRDYQVEALWDALNSRGGIMQLPTGGGKTRIAAAIFHSFDRHAMAVKGVSQMLFVSPSIDLATKNAQELRDILGPRGREIGLVCDGDNNASDDITVVTPESLHHFDPRSVGLVIYDEVHTLGSIRADKILEFEHAMRFGLSATPEGRSDGADIVVSGVFGPVIHRRTFQELVDLGALVPITIYWIRMPKPKQWRPSANRDTVYRRALWRNDEYHETVAHIMNHVVPDDVQCLTLVDKIEHMDSLLTHLPKETAYVHAATSQKGLEGLLRVKAVSKKSRQEIYRRVVRGEILRVVSTGIYRTGVDFPKMGAIIKAEGIASSIIAAQVPGRASRLSDGKARGVVFDFWWGWDCDPMAGATKPGMLLRDCKSREKVYKGLGFQQVFITNLDELDKIFKSKE